jgi:hypothetical protein
MVVRQQPAAGPWDGEPNNSGKNNESLEIEPCEFLTKCEVWLSMQSNVNMQNNMHYMQNNISENM